MHSVLVNQVISQLETSQNAAKCRCFVHFDAQMRLAPQRRAIFPDRNFQNWSLAEVLGTF